jgi:hypothetical protein
MQPIFTTRQAVHVLAIIWSIFDTISILVGFKDTTKSDQIYNNDCYESGLTLLCHLSDLDVQQTGLSIWCHVLRPVCRTNAHA